MSDVTNHGLPLAAGCPRAKAEGAFIALAAGDALGWPQEFPYKTTGGKAAGVPGADFRMWTRRSGGRFYAHEEIIRRGEYSDDTQLALAVARSCLCPGNAWWTAFTRTELPLWTLYERGGGGATKRAAELWVKGTAPWKSPNPADVRRYFEAGGNGVAMRVLPHAILHAGTDDASKLIRDVVTDGVATHGHPRALIGATVYAYAAWWLLRAEHTIPFGQLVDKLSDSASVWGELPAPADAKIRWLQAANLHTQDCYGALWNKSVAEMQELIRQVRAGIDAGAIGDDDDVLDRLGCFGKTKGSGTISTAAAVYLSARYAAQPLQAVLKAAFAKGIDTDTVAAMTGGLMGCLGGSDWLPSEWLSVQDCGYLRRLANSLAQGPSHLGEQPPGTRTVGQEELDALCTALTERRGAEIDLDGHRHVRIVSQVPLKSLSRTTVAQGWQLETSDGQTLYIAKLSRESRPEVHPGESGGGEPAASQGEQQRTVTGPVAQAAGVKLTVVDLSASVSFYEQAIGLVPVRKTQKFVSYGPVSLVDGRYAVELSSSAVSLNQSNGRNRIEIHVRDLDAAQRRLAEHHAPREQAIEVMPWGERSLHVTDPDGNVVELVEKRGR